MTEVKNINFSISQTTQAWATQKNLKTWFQKETASTNDFAKKDSSYDLYLTDHQTAGRGRGQNSWLDSGRGQLLSTWRFNLSSSPQHITGPLFGLALWLAARQTWPDLVWSLKAPNDLYLSDKKIAGLLIETLSQGTEFQLLVGLGFNVFNAPSSFQHSTCLNQWTNVDEKLWSHFITLWHKNCRTSCQSCSQTQMTLTDRELLKQALNLFPLLKAPILSVQTDGGLTYANHTVAWQNL